jgi:hypothetical protein
LTSPTDLENWVSLFAAVSAASTSSDASSLLAATQLISTAFRIDRDAEELLACRIKPPPGGGSVEFVVRIRVNGPNQRVYETRLKRQLRG